MKKARFLLGIGIWVALLPHLGFPYFLKNILFLVTGLLIVYIASLMYKENRKSRPKEVFFENFVENRNDENE